MELDSIRHVVHSTIEFFELLEEGVLVDIQFGGYVANQVVLLVQSSFGFFGHFDGLAEDVDHQSILASVLLEMRDFGDPLSVPLVVLFDFLLLLLVPEISGLDYCTSSR